MITALLALVIGREAPRARAGPGAGSFPTNSGLAERRGFCYNTGMTYQTVPASPPPVAAVPSRLPAPAGQSDLHWLGGLCLLVVAATTLPYALAALAAPPGQEFAGALNNTGDLAQYLAAIRQGAGGHWLYRDQFTDLAAPQALIYPLYTLLGQSVGRALSPLATYQAGRAIGCVALVLALYWFCGLLYTQRVHRRYACLLALTASGLYWLALAASGPLAALGIHPADLTAPEYSVGATLLGSPHAALGLAAQLLLLGCYARASSSGVAGPVRWRWVALGGVAGLALGASYPFNLLTVFSIVAVAALAQGVRLGRRGGAWATPLLIAALITLPALPLALYYYWLFHAQPMWRTSGMAVAATASPLVYLLAFGPLALLALAALPSWWPAAVGPPNGWTLVALWALMPPLLLAAPLWQAGRVTNGWSVALALLAARALLARPAHQARRMALALAPSTLLLPLIYSALALVVHPPAYYLPRELAAAGDWLGQHALATDVVLASARAGNALVARSDVAVVVGQNYQTFDLAGSQRAVAAFFSPALPAAERRRLLAAHRVTYVLAGPWEATLGRYNPAQAPNLTLAWRQGPWRLYRVAAGGLP